MIYPLPSREVAFSSNLKLVGSEAITLASNSGTPTYSGYPTSIFFSVSTPNFSSNGAHLMISANYSTYVANFFRSLGIPIRCIKD